MPMDEERDTRRLEGTQDAAGDSSSSLDVMQSHDWAMALPEDAKRDEKLPAILAPMLLAERDAERRALAKKSLLPTPLGWGGWTAPKPHPPQSRNPAAA